MSVFQVELKKVVDDSYEIEIGYQLQEKLIVDLKNGQNRCRRNFRPHTRQRR